MNIQMYLSAKVVIKESGMALVTERLVKQEWFAMISGLLGSVFGLMGTFATGLGYFEGLSKIYERKLEKKKKLCKVSRKSEKLKGEFGRFEIHPQDGKVHPTIMHEVTT